MTRYAKRIKIFKKYDMYKKISKDDRCVLVKDCFGDDTIITV